MFAIAYDHDGNTRIAIELMLNDRVEWKRNGYRGACRGEVREIGEKRVKLWLPDQERYVSVKPRFLSIHRAGRRLP